MTSGEPRTGGLGVIGLGTMGAPMAAHLLAAADDPGRLHVTARRPAAAADLVAAGAVWAPSPAALAAECTVIVTVLPDLPELWEVLEGPAGVLSGRTGDLLLVVCSTSAPDGVRALGVELTERTGGAVRVVDAPVSGGREGAIAGTLSILIGGADTDAATAADVLAPCGRSTHLGPLGSGQVAKACNQLVVAATTVALAEAAVIADRSGLDLSALFEAVGGGYAGSRLLEVKGPRFVAHDHEPASAARLMIKDLDFALAQARSVGTPTEHVQFLRGLFAEVVTAGLGDLDSSVVQRFLEERSAP
ncbi:NAD(P)-dependent oxidoreductase [Occultella glacieicola]|uniref:NAD(P)-dependent oxidoreductase n=1 Tax=Occultella glacieicola TaxID=2518684 RepID=A0ABY2E626_9MICO|nr:NAD(P)-dependent oxidoreductase [Occultella glacieicola]TDE91678.1 NAD(P)-dependent oxidoreductase [Occultella glacieicola]